MLAGRGGGTQLPGRRTRSECCSWASPRQYEQTKVCDPTRIEFQFPARRHNALSVFKDL